MGAMFNNRIRQIILLTVIIGLFVLLVINLYAFVPGMLGAITLYILSRNWYGYLTDRKHWSRVFTALLFIVLFIVALGIPIYLSIELLSSRVNTVLAKTQDMVKGFDNISSSVNEFLGFQVLTEENIQHFLSTLSDSVPGFLNSTIMILANLAMLLFLVFFMFVHEDEMAKVISGIIPLRHRNIYILSEETKRMIRANAIGIPLISIIQGLFATFGYWVFGIPQYGMWGFLTGMFAFFPLVGTLVIWLPLVIYQFSIGASGVGFGLGLYSLIVTGNVDYIARITLLRKIGDVHPVVTVLGVIVGLELFGFWGFIFGPLLISYFLLLLKIYRNEFGALQVTSESRKDPED